MTLTDALKVVVAYLDELMEETPSRELADVSNYLQAILDKEEL
jgi:hypothetical protein